MIREAIILAGGFGTRLRPVISELPKSLAPINGKPFLHYLILHLKKSGVEHIVLSVGYMSEKVMEQFGNEYLGIKVSYAQEETPLGTGGGIRLAMEKCSGADLLAMNGDSFFDFGLNYLFEKHISAHADATLALRKVSDGSRYGTVEFDSNYRITAFREKSSAVKKRAFINGGIYFLNRTIFLSTTEPNKNFSIENDFFSKFSDKLFFQGFPSDDYFIDIGIPEDFEKAQEDFGDLEW